MRGTMSGVLLLNGSTRDEQSAREFTGIGECVYRILDWEKPLKRQGKPFSCAVILLDFNDYRGGPMAVHMDFLARSAGVRKWVLAFMNVSGAFGAALDKWRLIGNSLKAGLKVLYQHSQLSDLREQILEQVEKDAYKCLIGYRSRKESAEEAASLLGELMEDWEFDPVSSGGLEDAMRGAGKLVLIGRDEPEFWIPPVSLDTGKDLLLFMDCPAPIFYDYYSDCMDAAIATLNGYGWSFKNGLPTCIISNLRYERWRQERFLAGEKEYDYQQLTVWDEYGLPCLHEDYTTERVSQFLSGFDGLEQVCSWLDATK